MRTLRMVNFLTLDGVMQGPGHPDEDRRGGFEHGGWVTPYLDDAWGRFAAEGMQQGDSLLFGRITYEKMAAYWPHQPDADPIAATMNRFTKYVTSTTLDQVSWENTVVITGDVVAEVSKLKTQPGKNITILGSGNLLRTLMRRDLIDEYALLLCPLILGSGMRLFDDALPKTPLTLVDSTTTSTGALILTYRPESRAGSAPVGGSRAPGAQSNRL
jgi:dihydrofolate reductase